MLLSCLIHVIRVFFLDKHIHCINIFEMTSVPIPTMSLQVLNHLLYLMRVSEKAVQTKVALAFAHLCAPGDQNTIFIHSSGTDNLAFLKHNLFFLSFPFLACWFFIGFT